MIRVYLLVIVLVLAFLLLRWFLKTPPAVVAGYFRRTGIVIIAVILVLLAAMGKLNWLIAVAGVAFASIARMLPVLLRYAPYLQRFWVMFNTAKNQSSKQNQHVASGKMSKAQAYDVLGLKPGATEQEIIQAHRKLMQKIHPDRGGSDYLAAQINQAKKSY
nr:DnaJ domain-containing protein [Methylomarinum sp. Ch1-1]MDP4520969.1 DnaJ domain-containing protein [Methylomarinum sp. Ch1-1]